MLLFRKTYHAALRDGSKTTTLRYWARRQVRPGSVHGVPHLGRLKIDAVETVAETDLTDEDARADGFASAQDLRTALAEMYPPDQRAGRELYKITFTFLDPQTEM